MRCEIVFPFEVSDMEKRQLTIMTNGSFNDGFARLDKVEPQL